MNNGLLEQQIRSKVLSVLEEALSEPVCDAVRCLLISVIHNLFLCEVINYRVI
jgi:hypothetical protein